MGDAVPIGLHPPFFIPLILKCKTIFVWKKPFLCWVIILYLQK